MYSKDDVEKKWMKGGKKNLLKLTEGQWCLVMALLVLVGVFVLLFSFPAISITTSELKTRSLFIDEHAIMVQSKETVRLWYETCSQSRTATTPSVEGKDFCEQYSQYLHTRCADISEKDDKHVIYEIYLEQGRQESTLLVFQASKQHKSSVGYVKKAIEVLTKLSQSTTWLVKDIAILFIEIDESVGIDWQVQQKVKEWSTRQLTGLREAYLFDLTSSSSNSSKDSFKEQSWQSLEVNIYGRNGQQVNLDLLSSALHFFPPPQLVLRSSSLSSSIDLLLRRHYLSVVQTVLGKDFLSKKAWESLEMKVLGLWQGLASSLRILTKPRDLSYLQAELLHRNVDVLAFSMTWTDDNDDEDDITASSLPLNSWDSDDFDLMVLQFVYLSNYLYEELHHSFFFYFTLGSQHFLGITEYSVVCVLFILPLLNHFLWLAFDHPLMNTETWLKDKKVLRRDRRLWCDAMMSVGLDLLPLAVLLFLLNCYSAIYKGSMVAGSEPFQTSTAWLWLQVIFLLDAINSLLKVWYKDSMTLLQSKMSILMLLLIVSLFAIGVQHVVLYLSLVVLVGSVLSWAAHSFHVRQTCQLQTYIDLHRNKEDNTFSKSLQVKTSWIQRISNFSLLCLAMMLSPCGICYITFLFNDHSHSLTTSLLEDYYQNSSFVFPAVLIVSTMTFKCILYSIQSVKSIR